MYYCYVGALRRGERTFIVALLSCGWPNNKSYKWKDTRALMEYGLANYEYREIPVKMEAEEIPVTDGADPEFPYRHKTAVETGLPGEEIFRMLLRKDEQVEFRTQLEEELKAPVRKGQQAGKVLCMLDGTKIREYEVVTLEAAEKRDPGWCLKVAAKAWLLCKEES